MQAKLLSDFFRAIDHDARIGPTHICLYATLVQLYSNKGHDGPLLIYSHEVMPVARIGSSATFHRVLHDLADNGYLRYEPNFSRKRSKVYL